LDDTNRILVTGATGNVGKEIVAGLLQKGAKVTAAVRDPAKARAQLGDNLEYVEFDFKRPDTFRAFDGSKRVFLVRPPDIADVSKFVTPAVVAAKQRGVDHFVFLSLLGVEKNPVVPHYKIEQALMAADVDWTFLRASFFMQNLSTTHRDEIRQHNEIFVPAGRGRTSFIDVRDIAAVGVKTLTEEGHRRKEYPLTGDVALNYFEVADALSYELGRKITYANPSPLRFWNETRKRGVPADYTLVMLALYSTARFGLAGKVTPDTHELLERPALTIHRFIEDNKTVWM
jgi:uncharacterized protein YbjT (DUF2867 family)